MNIPFSHFPASDTTGVSKIILFVPHFCAKGNEGVSRIPSKKRIPLFFCSLLFLLRKKATIDSETFITVQIGEQRLWNLY